MIEPVRSYVLAAEGAADENMEEEDVEEKAETEVQIDLTNLYMLSNLEQKDTFALFNLK